MKYIQINNLSRTSIPPFRAACYASYWHRFKGLMFQSKLNPHEGVLLVENKEDRINSSIHMFFMRFSITTVWIDAKYIVADVQFAEPWHPIYIPRSPAKYILEIGSDHINDFAVGDQLEFINA